MDHDIPYHKITKLDIKQLSTVELKAMLKIIEATMKQFQVLTDDQFNLAVSRWPQMPYIISATFHNLKLVTNELTLRQLPLN